MNVAQLFGTFFAAIARATWTLFHPKMWALILMPFLVASAIWVAVGWLAWDPMTAMARDLISSIYLPDWLLILLQTAGIASLFGAMNHAILVPMLALFVMLPLVMVTAVTLVAMFAMPVIVGHVTAKKHNDLEKQGTHGAFIGLFASAWNSLKFLLIFVVLWALTLPLWLIPLLGWFIPFLLWAWAVSRVFSYDVLQVHASKDERKMILSEHRWALVGLGAVSSLAGAAPSLVWLSGATMPVILPFLALISVAIYVLVFVWTGLMFSYYLLAVLVHHRALHPRFDPTKIVLPEEVLPAIAISTNTVPVRAAAEVL